MDSFTEKKLTEAMVQSWSNYLEFLAFTQDLEAAKIPKRHVTLHMHERMPDFGNPKDSAHGYDENLNKDLKATLWKTIAF